MLPWTTAWITGASTGIGRELALLLARQGVRVAVSARQADKLAELVALHPNITAFPVDVTDREAIVARHADIVASLGPVDLAVLNAGVWDPMGAEDYGAARAAASMSVNYLGVTNALEPLIAAMIARRAGHIALVASVAGYGGLPKAAAYAPTKAAVINLAEVLRLDLERHGVTVSLVNPGFVDTPMTAVNKFPMPFKITATDAAQRILKGLAQRRFEIAFPWQLVTILKVLGLLPYGLYFRLVRSATMRNPEGT